jgi:hypothetical protein
MSDESPENAPGALSRRQFLDVLSKSVIATTAFCLVTMSDSAAAASLTPDCGPGGKGGAKGGPPPGGKGGGPNPYAPYCPPNPYHPYNPYPPYHPGNPHPPYNPYNPYLVY